MLETLETISGQNSGRFPSQAVGRGAEERSEVPAAFSQVFPKPTLLPSVIFV